MPRTTVAPPRPTYPPAAPPEAPQRLNLSVTQVVASGLAALTATVVMSFLGVAGTVIGAVVGSVCSVVGTAVYGHSLRRTRDRLTMRRATLPPQGHLRAPAANGWAQPTYHSARRPAAGRSSRRSRTARLAMATTVVFLALLGCVTSVEALAHRPLADVVRNQSGSGTSFFGGGHRSTSASASASRTGSRAVGRHHRAAAPTVTRTVTAPPTHSATSTAKPSSTPSQRRSPSTAPSTTPSAPATSETPGASVTPH